MGQLVVYMPVRFNGCDEIARMECMLTRVHVRRGTMEQRQSGPVRVNLLRLTCRSR